jgi:hypothetical protein
MRWHVIELSSIPQIIMTHNELILRQQRLLGRSAELRLHLADQAQVLQNPLAMADQARSCLQWLRSNPQWSIGGLIVLLVLKPKRTIIWGGRLWWAWKSLKRAQNWLAKLPRQSTSPTRYL